MPTSESMRRRDEVRQRIAKMLDVPAESVTVPEHHPLYDLPDPDEQARQIAETFIEQVSRSTGIPRTQISVRITRNRED